MDLAGEFAGQVQERDYRVTAKIGGTLKAIEASVGGVIAQTRATAHAVFEPFAPVPLKTITIDAADVDASRFAATLPRTRIALHATLAPEGKSIAGPVRMNVHRRWSANPPSAPMRATINEDSTTERKFRQTRIDVAPGKTNNAVTSTFPASFTPITIVSAISTINT